MRVNIVAEIAMSSSLAALSTLCHSVHQESGELTHPCMPQNTIRGDRYVVGQTMYGPPFVRPLQPSRDVKLMYAHWLRYLLSG
jgi:hypothetical protein